MCVHTHIYLFTYFTYFTIQHLIFPLIWGGWGLPIVSSDDGTSSPASYCENIR